MTVVFLHALPFGASMWRGLAGECLDDVVCPDLYEFGDTIGAWAEAVLDATHGPLTLVGNSVGGSCAIEVAARAPERIERLVLIGTKAGHRPEPALRDQAVRVLLEDGLAAAWEKYWLPLFADATGPDLLASARDLALDQRVDAIVRGVRAFHSRPDRSDWIKRCARPVAVVEGAHDRPPRGRALAASAPAGAFHLVPDAGHYVPLEAPTALNAIICNRSRDS